MQHPVRFNEFKCGRKLKLRKPVVCARKIYGFSLAWLFDASSQLSQSMASSYCQERADTMLISIRTKLWRLEAINYSMLFGPLPFFFSYHTIVLICLTLLRPCSPFTRHETRDPKRITPVINSPNETGRSARSFFGVAGGCCCQAAWLDVLPVEPHSLAALFQCETSLMLVRYLTLTTVSFPQRER